MRTATRVLTLIFGLLCATLARGTSPPVYEFDWVGGQAGFSGRILLNAASSSLAPDGGSDADVLPGSYVTTPLGTFSLLDKGLDAAFDPPGSAVLWDQTHVIYMNLFFDPVNPIINPAYGLPAIGNALANTFNGPDNAVQVGSLVGGFGTVYAEDDFTGQWLPAPVPEASPASLLGIGCAWLAFGTAIRRSQRSLNA